MYRNLHLVSAGGWLLLSLLAGTAVASSQELPNAAHAGFVDNLYRLDCGRSLANDESVWTSGENQGRSIEFSSTCWLVKRGNQWLLWDTGVPDATINDPNGWSTLPKLIVYHLDKTVTGQLAEIGLKPSDVTYVAISHTHGDHIGNVGLFPDAEILTRSSDLIRSTGVFGDGLNEKCFTNACERQEMSYAA